MNNQTDELNDALFNQAICFVQEKEEILLADLQYHFRIGFYRAHQLIKAMENAHIIATLDKDNKHKVLITKTK